MGSLQPTERERDDEKSRSNDTPASHLADPPTDGMFTILSNPRRRYTIEYLVGSPDDTVRLRDLAEQIAAWENDVSPHEITYKQRKRVYTSLYQTHLPRMDRAGVVEYDRRSGIVRSTSEVAELRTHLETTGSGRDWDAIGLVASGLSIAFVAVGSLGPVPFGGDAGYVIAFVVSALFLLVSVAQYSDV